MCGVGRYSELMEQNVKGSSIVLYLLVLVANSFCGGLARELAAFC